MFVEKVWVLPVSAVLKPVNLKVHTPTCARTAEPQAKVLVEESYVMGAELDPRVTGKVPVGPAVTSAEYPIAHPLLKEATGCV